MVNGCEKCQEHDDKTKELMKQLFDDSEVVHIISLLVANIGFNLNMKKQPRMNDRQKMGFQATVDFNSAILGKLVNALPPEKRQVAIDHVRKNMDIKINITHEPCPHRERA